MNTRRFVLVLAAVTYAVGLAACFAGSMGWL